MLQLITIPGMELGIGVERGGIVGLILVIVMITLTGPAPQQVLIATTVI